MQFSPNLHLFHTVLAAVVRGVGLREGFLVEGSRFFGAIRGMMFRIVGMDSKRCITFQFATDRANETVFKSVCNKGIAIEMLSNTQVFLGIQCNMTNSPSIDLNSVLFCCSTSTLPLLICSTVSKL